MYIEYKNILYGFLSDDMELLTYKSEKINNTFEEDDGIFYKKISDTDSNIQEIFEVHYLIDYDTGLKCVPTTWRVETERVEFLDDEVLLVFGHG